MSTDKYIYTFMGSIISSACICNICSIPQYGFFIIALVFAGAGVGAQFYADRKQEQIEAEEREVVKQIQAMLDLVLKEVSGCAEECRKVNHMLDSIAENQRTGIDRSAKIQESIELISCNMEGGMTELKQAIINQTERCNGLLESGKKQNEQNGKVISEIEDLAQQLTEHKNEICGRIGMYAATEGTVQEMRDVVSEIRDSCNGMLEGIGREIDSLKDEIVNAMGSNTEGQDKIVERYDMLTGKINNLITELGKEASDVVRALRDFYQMVNLKDKMNRRGK